MRLWKHLHDRIRFGPEVSLMDSFSEQVCRFARADRCCLLPEGSAFGYDEMTKQTVYGFRAPARLLARGDLQGRPRPSKRT